MSNQVQECNISVENFKDAILNGRLVAIIKVGKGETDYIELRIINKDSYYMRRVIGKGYSDSKNCYPVRGGGYDKAQHVVEVIASTMSEDMWELAQNNQHVQKIYM